MDPTVANVATNVAAVADAVAPIHDVSIFGLFWQADILVKLIMLGLVGCSIWSWAIIADKFTRLRFLNKRATRFEEVFWSGNSLDALYDRLAKNPGDPMSATFVSGMREWKHGTEKGIPKGPPAAGLHARIERVMGTTIGREMGLLERYMIFLASVGSVAPFVGLFGTVWGIMRSFTAIANSNNTSLAVVAPGIAEALFATALGLVAAIPAVISYNKFSTDLGRYADRLDGFSQDFSAILSRYIEERATGSVAA